MSGHSKWKQIKRQKESSDIKKGQLFSKIIHAITVASKEDGGDPETNFKLRLAIEKARGINMPQDNIDRAIKKATEGSGSPVESVIYEAYGPGGVALLIETLTDNHNRTTGEIKNTLSKNGGRLGAANSVKWLFEEKGVITVDPQGKKEEEIELNAIDAGAEDVQSEGNEVTILTIKEDCQKIKDKLAAKYKIISAEITRVPKNKVKIEDEKILAQIESLVDKIESQEEVNQIYTNIA